MTISAALRTDSMTSPRALHTPTCPGVSPLSRAHGAAPDTALERGSLARELEHRRWECYGDPVLRLKMGKLLLQTERMQESEEKGRG